MIRTCPRKIPARVLQARARRHRSVHGLSFILLAAIVAAAASAPFFVLDRATLVLTWWMLAVTALTTAAVLAVSIRQVSPHAKEAAGRPPLNGQDSKVPVDFDRAWREGVE